MQHYSWLRELRLTQSQQSHACAVAWWGQAVEAQPYTPCSPNSKGQELQWGITASRSSRPWPADLFGAAPCSPAVTIGCLTPARPHPAEFPLQTLPCNAMLTYFGGWRSAAQLSAAQGPQSAVTASLGSALDFGATAST